MLLTRFALWRLGVRSGYANYLRFSMPDPPSSTLVPLLQPSFICNPLYRCRWNHHDCNKALARHSAACRCLWNPSPTTSQ
ncbi:hypothetical protein D6D27_04746 [Aureobasidium pullulans]|nr:hypothetical protein D6D27_04746 [Aureobasidium pullulans]